MNLYKPLNTAIYFLFFLLGIQGFSQSPHFKFYDLLKGYPQGVVNTVFQDSKGVIWVGSSDGLFSFDGLNFKRYTVEENLAGNFITCIAEDNQHRLWVGHNRGMVSILDAKKNATNYREIDTIFDAEISSIKFTEDGQTIIGSRGDGMLIIENNEYTLHALNTDGFDDFIYDIAVKEDSVLWVASDEGIMKFSLSSETWSTLSTKNGLPDNIIAGFDFDQNGNCWIASKEKGVALIKSGEQKAISIPDWKYGNINDVSVKSQNDIWISTETSGVVRLRINEKGEYEYVLYHENNGLKGSRFTSLLKDKHGYLWMGSDRGLCFHSNDFFQFYTMEDQLPDKEVIALNFDKQNRLWLASSNSLYLGSREKGGQYHFSKLNSNWGPTLFSSIFCDKLGNIWVGTYGDGIYIFDQVSLKFQHITKKEGLSNNNVSSISGSDNDIMITTLGGGVNWTKSSSDEELTFKHLDKNDGLGSDYLYASFQDKSGKVWLAKDGGGVATLNGNSVQEDQAVKEFCNVTYGVVQDHEGSLWFTTSNKGIIKFDGKDYEQITSKDGLLSNSYSSLALTKDSLIIFSSNEGVSIINPLTMQIYNYDDNDGLAFMKPNLNACATGPDGGTWIGTNNGIIKFTGSKSIIEKDDIEVMIINTMVLLNELKDSVHVLSHDQNHLIIDYLGLCYSSPEKLFYRYKMEGLDLDWVYANKAQSASYSGLSPGTYTFIVQASINEKQWVVGNSASTKFTIKPPFWQTLWFGLLSAILIVTIFVFTIKNREKRFKKSELKLKLEVERRTHEISLQKAEILAQNKDIRDSIQYAKRIQGAILPEAATLKKGLDNYFLFYQPKDIVAGDFYWFKQKGDKALFAAADCTGHGVPGAMVSVVCNNALERASTEFDLSDPGLILDKTRDIVTEQFITSDEDVKDGMDISICALEGHSLQFAGANNPLWLVRLNTKPELKLENSIEGVSIKRHDGGTHSIWEIKGDKQPVGRFDHSKSFTTKEIKLIPGDIIYLFTDGIPDQFGGEKGKKLKLKGLREFLFSQQRKTFSDQQTSFEEFFNSWKGNLEQLDDVCLLVVKIK